MLSKSPGTNNIEKLFQILIIWRITAFFLELNQAKTIQIEKKDPNNFFLNRITRISEGYPGLLGAVTSRGEAQVMRLTLLYALLDQSNLIKKVHIEAAYGIWKYSFLSAMYIFGKRIGNKTTDTILDVLRASESGLSKTDIHGLFENHKSTTEIDWALTILSQLGKIEIGNEKTNGRSRKTYHAKKDDEK